MAGFKVNIFYVVSSACSLVLVGYLWLVFLPQFENAVEYSAIQTVTILLTAFLLVAFGVQIFLALKKREPQ